MPEIERESPGPVPNPALVLYIGSCPSWGYHNISVSEGALFSDSPDNVEKQRYAKALRLVDHYMKTGHVQIHGTLFNNDADAERFIALCLKHFPDVRAGISLSHSGHGEIIFRKDISLEGELNEKKARSLLKKAGFKAPITMMMHL